MSIRERNDRLEVIVYLGRDGGKPRRVSRTVRGTDAAARETAERLEAELRELKPRTDLAPGFQAMYGYDTTQRLDWKPAGTLVYRIFERDVVLYVGVTSNLFHRMSRHHTRPAFAGATHVEWDLYPTREIALAVERGLIAELEPIYNVVGVPL